MKKIKIVDISTLIPGPFASYLLNKHLDAEIIKFEDNRTGDPFINLRPTKEGIGLSYSVINNLKTVRQIDFSSGGLNAILNEIKEADIFIENYKTGKADKLGLGFEDVKKTNPNIFYCSITGYPKTHPLVGCAAHDLNILALSGYLDMQNKLNNLLFPPPVQLADLFTSYHLSICILSAIIKGEKGIKITVSMFEALSEALIIYNYPILKTSRNINTDDAIMSGTYPCYSIYKTKDNGFAAVAALEKPLWIDFLNHIKREDLTEKQFDPLVFMQVQEEMLKYARKEWLKNDFCVSPILSVLETRKAKYV
jgi:crotonobetainyl-CoA:carnitine CoA-transferase CaiB-like acyl-CoA transferase